VRFLLVSLEQSWPRRAALGIPQADGMTEASENKKTINVKKRSGKFVGAVEVEDATTADEFKELFNKKFHYYPERQRFYIGNANGPFMKDGKLFDASGNNLKDGDTVIFKDLGVQISWRLVFVMEYFGPLWIFPLFMYFPSLFYKAPVSERSLTQKVAFVLVMFHFLKREFESLFVHRFSNATMPIVRLPLNCIHYWVIFAAMVGYFLFHPKYSAPFLSPQITYLLAAIFLLFEALNFQTHLVLRNLRPRGTKKRGMPHGWGFELVSSANYMWETLAWISFCIMTQTVTGWVFTVVAFYFMATWAVKKHKQYRKEFHDYPRIRKAIVPFFL